MEIAALQAALQDNELRLVLINVAAGDYMQGGDGLACIPGREADFRQALQQAADYVQALNVPRVNVLSGRKPNDVSQEACFGVLNDNLHEAVAVLKKAGAGTVVEAINPFDMPHTLVHSLKHMQLLCQDIHGLQMQFDCYHMSRMGEDILETLRHNLGQVGHIQFADNPGRHEPGTGRLDYRPVFSLLHESDYSGWCGAEYKPSRQTEDTLGWMQLMEADLKESKT
ncbi:MAG TPA: TIM barrel protein, partial [Moraxellaceae bacterium]